MSSEHRPDIPVEVILQTCTSQFPIDIPIESQNIMDTLRPGLLKKLRQIIAAGIISNTIILLLDEEAKDHPEKLLGLDTQTLPQFDSNNTPLEVLQTLYDYALPFIPELNSRLRTKLGIIFN